MLRTIDRNVDIARAGRMILVAVACIAASLGSASAIDASQATPDAIAPASSCTIPPLTLPLFGGTPVTPPIATPETLSVQDLTPVSDDVASAVREGVAEILACLNVGDPKVTYAVFTTNYLARTYGDPATAYLPAFEQSLDEVPDSPVPQYVIQGFAIVGQSSDGRVVASITLAAGEDVWADQLVLADVDGQWLIDDILT